MPTSTNPSIMGIRLLRLPFLAQQNVIKQMPLKPVFLLATLSTKMSKIVFLALKSERISLAYNANRNIEITRQIQDEHKLDLFHQSEQCLALPYKFFKLLKQNDVSTREVSTGDAVFSNSIQTFWPFELEDLMKFILRKFPNAILKLKFETPDIEIFRRTMDMIKESQRTTAVNLNEIRVEPRYSDIRAIWVNAHNAFIHLVLNEGRCAKRLHVLHIPASIRFVYDTRHPPFTFEEFSFTDAKWLSKHFFMKLLLTCKDVHLTDVMYSNEDLVAILKGWRESSSLKTLYMERTDINRELNLEVIMKQFPLARIVRCVRFPSESPNRSPKDEDFYSKQCFEIQKLNGEEKLIIFYKYYTLRVISNYEALEFEGEEGENWENVREEDDDEESDGEQ